MTTPAQPNTTPHLNGRHRRTYDAIFRHPTAHNLEWHDLRSLLDAIAKATNGQKGMIELTTGQMLALHSPKQKGTASIEDVVAIRHLLEKLGETAPPPEVAPGTHLLVVIDHHEAKIYRTELQGSVPQQLVPYDPHGFGRHLCSDTEETDGKRKPERKSFYEAVAATLRGADQILIFGHGTGESSAMEQLLADLRRNHVDVAKHIIGSLVTDGDHMTEGQLLAKAREFFAAAND